jgi:hypothetical protein
LAAGLGARRDAGEFLGVEVNHLGGGAAFGRRRLVGTAGLWKWQLPL